MENSPTNSYLASNKEAWNLRTEQHIHSDFYNVAAFLEGKNSLNSIELDLLGDVRGKRILHLQCHFGQDSLSLQRMGAQVSGVDLSNKAIDYAKELNEEMSLHANFVCCDVYDTPMFIEEKFDIVFTSYGTIGWLPDLNRWAEVVSHFLKPGGKFVFVEFHPVVWMFDYEFKEVAYSYFNQEAIVEENTGTYTDVKEEIKYTDVSWNHSLDEVLGSLLKYDIEIESFSEFPYSPYACFKNTVEVEPRKFMIKGLEGKLPMVYSLLGKKR
jgi:SAM-dependent methyltransferase